MTRPLPTAGSVSALAGRQTTISQLLIALGIVVLLCAVTGRLVRQAGGWYFVRRRVGREIRLTAAAFAAPVRSWRRYRRQLQLLKRLLADPTTWHAGERAMRSVDALTPERCRPYATVVGADLVGVFIAGLDVPQPPDPWISDDADPNLWWSVRETWNDPPAGGQQPPEAPVLLTALGVADSRAVFLDLADGPSVTAVYGDEQASDAVIQAIAAQLDRRLPPGAVTVADGIHPRHAAPPAAQALRDAAAWQARCGAPAFAVCAEPLPEQVGPDGPFVLMRGRARGRARLMTVNRNSGVVVHGTRLRPEAVALPKALARTIRGMPPYQPPTKRPDRSTDVEVAVPVPALGRSASAPGAAAAPRPAAPTTAAPTVAPAPRGEPWSVERSGPDRPARSTGVSASAAATPAEQPPARTGDREEFRDTATPSSTGASAVAPSLDVPGTTASASGDGD
jgi:hypothetical protein